MRNPGRTRSGRCSPAPPRSGAALVTDPTARAQAWANVDKMLVNQAVAVPEDFDNQPNVESKDVAGVNELWNTGTWDLDFTSLKNS